MKDKNTAPAQNAMNYATAEKEVLAAPPAWAYAIIPFVIVGGYYANLVSVLYPASLFIGMFICTMVVTSLLIALFVVPYKAKRAAAASTIVTIGLFSVISLLMVTWSSVFNCEKTFEPEFYMVLLSTTAIGSGAYVGSCLKYRWLMKVHLVPSTEFAIVKKGEGFIVAKFRKDVKLLNATRWLWMRCNEKGKEEPDFSSYRSSAVVFRSYEQAEEAAIKAFK